MALRDFGKNQVLTSVIIFALALVIRFGWIATSAHELRSDELDYHSLAQSLAQSATYAIDGVPTAYRPPGYPFALWMVYSATGPDKAAALWIQAILDASLAVLIFLSLSKAHILAAPVAGIAWAIFPAAILYSGLLLTETLFTVMLFSALFILERTKALTPAAFSGLLLGIACLIKPWALLFVALLAAFGLLRKDPDKRFVLVAMIAVLTLLPWMLRNELHMGFFGISTNTGMNLYVGNRPDATGGYRGNFPPEIAAAAGDELRLDSLSTSLATGYIMSEPLSFVANAGLKLARLIASEGELLVLALSADSADISYRERLSYLSPAAKVLVNLPSFVFLLFGIAGLIAARPSTGRTSALLLVASIVLTSIVFFGSSRFRFPAMPFLVMYSALAATSLRSTVKGLSPLRRVMVACSIVAVAAVWIIEFTMLANA